MSWGWRRASWPNSNMDNSALYRLYTVALHTRSICKPGNPPSRKKWLTRIILVKFGERKLLYGNPLIALDHSYIDKVNSKIPNNLWTWSIGCCISTGQTRQIWQPTNPLHSYLSIPQNYCPQSLLATIRGVVVNSLTLLRQPSNPS